jgi:hypothetical protein
MALGGLLVLYGVDVPFWDQWSITGLAEAFHLHILTFGQLFAQFNEHRLFFPRVLLIGTEALARGNVKWDLAVLWVLAAIVLFNVYRLAARTLEGTGFRLITTTFLASLLIFSPIQYQNWLWGMQVDMLLPMTCLSTALVVLYSNRSPWLKLLNAAALAAIAGFSYLNGLTGWILLLPAVLQEFKEPAAKARAALLWIAIAAVSLAAFFHGYLFLGTSPHLADLLSQSELVITSFLAFLGSPLSFGSGINEERLAHFLGAAILLAAGFALLKLNRIRCKAGILRRAMPWLTIGAYALATAIIVTIGRATSSSQRLLESRYTSFSVYLFVALIFLLPILYEDAKLRPWVGRALVLLILLLHVGTARYALAQMQESRTDRLQSKACLAFFNLIDDPCQTQRLDWDDAVLRQRVASLQRLDFFHPPLVRSPDLRLIAGSTDPSSKLYGVFESLTNAGSGFYRATGSATLSQGSHAADAVILSYLRADGTPVAFALSGWTKSDSPSHWEKWFELPPGGDRIQVWAYDAISGRAFRLSDEYQATTAPPLAIRFGSQARGFVDAGKSRDASTLNGWAVLLNQHKPADMVVLTCGGENAIVAAAQPWQPRPDVARELGDARYLKSGWQIQVRPRGPACALKAWAYDAAANEAGLLRDLR